MELGALDILKDIICRPFNFFEQNGYLQSLIGCVLGKGGHGGWFSLMMTTPPHPLGNGL